MRWYLCGAETTEYFEGLHGGRVAIVCAEFFEDVAEVDFYGLLGHAEDDADFGVGLALGNPEEDLGFSWGEVEPGLERGSGGEVGLESHLFAERLFLFDMTGESSPDGG